jgi:hypothetical protein
VGKVKVGFQPGASQWQSIVIDTMGGTQLGDLSYTEPSLADHKFQLVSKWIILRVDSGGTVVAVGNPGTNGNAVSDSCASSLVGAAVVKMTGG